MISRNRPTDPILSVADLLARVAAHAQGGVSPTRVHRAVHRRGPHMSSPDRQRIIVSLIAGDWKANASVSGELGYGLDTEALIALRERVKRQMVAREALLRADDEVIRAINAELNDRGVKP